MVSRKTDKPDYYAEDNPTFRAYEELMIYRALAKIDLSRHELCKLPGITPHRVDDWLKSLVRLKLGVYILN